VSPKSFIRKTLELTEEKEKEKGKKRQEWEQS
jgi:hypothetical protein